MQTRDSIATVSLQKVAVGVGPGDDQVNRERVTNDLILSFPLSFIFEIYFIYFKNIILCSFTRVINSKKLHSLTETILNQYNKKRIDLYRFRISSNENGLHMTFLFVSG